jgi:hypothetical protein
MVVSRPRVEVATWNSGAAAGVGGEGDERRFESPVLEAEQL